MDLIVDPVTTSRGHLTAGRRVYDCALGRGGIRADKREGDGATPVGAFALETVYYRADRVPRPCTQIPVLPLSPDLGWCEAPDDPLYNQPVRLPYPAGRESMWRRDPLYDIVVVLDHNRHPVRPGAGSAIFLHIARPAYAPTAGCVALALPDLIEVLRLCDRETQLVVTRPSR